MTPPGFNLAPGVSGSEPFLTGIYPCLDCGTTLDEDGRCPDCGPVIEFYQLDVDCELPKLAVPRCDASMRRASETVIRRVRGECG